MSGYEQRPGDYRVTCDYSGFQCWASETVMTWNGFRVHRRFAGEETQRHPQDYVRGRAERTAVPWSRPVSETYLPDYLKTSDGVPILDGSGNPITTS